MFPAAAEYPPPAELPPRLLEVYRERASYDFAQRGITWVSQQTVADHLGIDQATVCRRDKELCRAGYMRIFERRQSTRYVNGCRQKYIVYELLVPVEVSDLAAKRITKRAHRRRTLLARLTRSGRPVHSNPVGDTGWCSCWACRPSKEPRIRGRAPRLAVSRTERRTNMILERLGYVPGQAVRVPRLGYRPPEPQSPELAQWDAMVEAGLIVLPAAV